MITITAFKWVPPFAQGQVRDFRLRWILNEVGWDYRVRLIDTQDQKSDAYRAEQPFGQVPVLEEDGQPAMFETGAIVLDIATRAGKLIPSDPGEHSRMLCWLFAALNTLEPYLMNLAEVDYFINDETHKKVRRPSVVQMVQQRLGEVEKALGDRAYFASDEFTIADLMMASVLKITPPDILENYSALVAFQERCLARDAYKRAVADQCAVFAQYSAKDMKRDQ